MSRRERMTALALCVVGFVGCRGGVSDRPPLRLLPNMDQQHRHAAQEVGRFGADGSAMRAPVPGTVAAGSLHDDDHLHRAVGIDGELVDSLPPSLGPDPRRLEQGYQRYAIFCAPCHDSAGTGAGIVIERGMVTPPSLLDARLRQQPLGHLYKVIAEGVRNMPAHAAQIPVEHRWAIATYVRSLQSAGNAGRDRQDPDEGSEEGWR